MQEINEKEWYSYLQQEKIPWECIDAELRNLIWLLNKIPGIKTRFCCTGHDEEYTYIILSSNLELNALYDLFKIILKDDEDNYGYLMDVQLDLFNSNDEDHRFILTSKTFDLLENIRYIIWIENHIMKYMKDHDMDISKVYNFCYENEFYIPQHFHFYNRMSRIFNTEENENGVCN